MAPLQVLMVEPPSWPVLLEQILQEYLKVICNSHHLENTHRWCHSYTCLVEQQMVLVVPKWLPLQVSQAVLLAPLPWVLVQV